MTSAIERALNGLTRVRGVRGALAVSRDDGLVVADALMEGVRGPAVAALTASLTKRLGRGGIISFLTQTIIGVSTLT